MRSPRTSARARRSLKRSRAGRSRYGYASAFAQAIDVSRHPHIAGTIGGENTVLLVAREPFTGAQLAAELQLQRLRGAA